MVVHLYNIVIFTRDIFFLRMSFGKFSYYIYIYIYIYTFSLFFFLISFNRRKNFISYVILDTELVHNNNVVNMQ